MQRLCLFMLKSRHQFPHCMVGQAIVTEQDSNENLEHITFVGNKVEFI